MPSTPDRRRSRRRPTSGTRQAVEAGITRAALDSTYLSLKEEFGRRRDQLRHTGVIPDPRDAQIERLKQQMGQLKDRLASQEQDNG
jgi:hypothetical protein